MPAELRMVRMRFDVPRLFELGKRRRLPVGEADLGYLIHCGLKELFGDDAPGPFSVLPGESRHVTVMAYTSRSRDELLKHADVAMYRSKELGRNTYQFLDASLAEHRVKQHSLETSLRAALRGAKPRSRRGQPRRNLFDSRMGRRARGRPAPRDVLELLQGRHRLT